ncbi:ABC transporter ATP-binding protein [Eubacterium sp.]|uniref:ABC transporter ATP-binding protein n=1 Tax=Eubacterium sp. TaxID=142586 RepID=UPI003EFD5B1A
MRFIRIDKEQENVPVLQNVIYALRLVWKADKKLLIGYFMQEIFGNVFSWFIRNILFLKVLLEIITGNKDFGVYCRCLILFAVLSVADKVVTWTGMRIQKKATKNVLKNINNMVFDKAQTLDVSCYEDPAFYDKYQRATLVVTSGYFDIICYDFASMLSGIISMICVFATVMSINPAYLLFLIPVFFVFVIETAKSKYVYKRDMEMTSNNRIKAYVQRTMFLREYSKDMRTSNIFSVLMKRFEAAIDSNIKILKKYGVGLFAYSMVSSLFEEFIPVIGSYLYAGYEFVSRGTMTVSGFSVVLSSINSVREVTLDVTQCFDEMNQMALYFQNLRTFFEYQPSIVSGEKRAEPFESLEFKNVSFRYPSAKSNSIENVSFKLTKGETLAVVGINGAGKSTLLKLMLRFYDVTEGEILYNGINIKEYDLNSYRNAFATVFQDYKNFAVSVYENVMCRVCNADDKQAAMQALKNSGAWKKISTFSKGGDTVLTKEFDKDGAGLSGGENQKVSTARLFARDFDVAILDEPSSALDPIAESEMYDNLTRVTENKTVVYISHRLSSAALADRIIVLEKGSIIESGSHSELMALNGKYTEMFSLQASNYNKEAI